MRHKKEQYKEIADEELIVLAVDNPSAFEEIVFRYEEAFLRKAKHILRISEEAEDSVQDTFVKIFLNAKKFQKQEGASFKSWAYKILINTCFTKYSKRKRDMQFVMELDPELLEIIEDPNNLEEEKRLDMNYLLSAISKLPETLSKITIEHFIEGKPQSIIAEESGLSNVAVRARIHRAKKKLQEITKNNF